MRSSAIIFVSTNIIHLGVLVKLARFLLLAGNRQLCMCAVCVRRACDSRLFQNVVHVALNLDVTIFVLICNLKFTHRH